jgi:hypothetical protein
MDEDSEPVEPYAPPAVIYEGQMKTRAGTPPTGCPTLRPRVTSRNILALQRVFWQVMVRRLCESNGAILARI